MALGLTQPPMQCVTGALSLGVKQPESEADHSPLSHAPLPQYAFMAWCSINKSTGTLPIQIAFV
jgi:hypothetical protein